jgi:hypothetical protein
MWKTEPTTGWQSSAVDFSHQNPKEMPYILKNLAHFLAQLRVAINHKSIEALYLHRFESGIVAIDQNGIEDGLTDSFLYAFPDDATRILFLLCVGKASDKDADMEYCKRFVFYLVNERA